MLHSIENKVNFSFLIKNYSLEDQDKNEYWKVHVTLYNGTYTIPIVSLIGSFLNAITLSIFFNPKFKKNKYSFVTAKVVNDFLGSLIGIGFQNYLKCILEKFVYFNFCTETYSLVHSIFKVYIYKYIGFPLFLLSGILNSCIAYDRYLTLRSKSNWFNKKTSFKYIVSLSVISLLVLFVPILFAFQIDHIGNKRYLVKMTKFGEKKIFILYISNLVVIGCLANLIVFISLNVLTYNKYKEFIKKNDRTCSIYIVTSQFRKQVKKMKFRIEFLKMAFILTSIFFMSRFFEFMGFLCASLHYKFKLIDDDFLILIGNIVFIFFYFEMGINFFVLFRFNLKFRQSFLKIYCCK